MTYITLNLLGENNLFFTNKQSLSILLIKNKRYSQKNIGSFGFKTLETDNNKKENRRNYKSLLLSTKIINKLLTQISIIHPNKFFLLADIITHHGIGAFVISFGCNSKNLTLFNKYGGKCIQYRFD